MEIKIEIWKNSGKWYTTITEHVETIEKIDIFMSNFSNHKGMTATVYYWKGNVDNYYQPYRIFKL